MASDTDLRDDAAAPPDATPADGGASPRGRGLLRVVLPLGLVLVAGVLRFADLAYPERQYFDEVYYAQDSADYLELGVESGRAVHPMIGKWLIAGGIAAFGDDSFGWRFSAAAAGTLTVLALYLLGVRLFRRRGVAALAAFLLAVDGMAFTTSRISMLDVFLGLFVVLGFWTLLVDRDRFLAAAPTASGDAPDADVPDGALEGASAPHPGAGPPTNEVDAAVGLDGGGPTERPAEAGRAAARATPLVTWPRLLAGLAFGLALGTKWSALLAIGAAGLFVFGLEYGWRRRVTGSVRPGAWRPLVSAAVTLVLVPLAVYLVSHVTWFANYENTQPGVQRCGPRDSQTTCEASPTMIFGDWVGEQVDNYQFHRDLEAEHRYRAPAYTWPVLGRPVAYYYENCRADRDADAGPCIVDEGDVEEILGIGNPMVWWPALLLGYPMLLRGMWRRDWRAWAIAVFLLGQFLPWLVSPRTVFLFYTVPLVPFIALGLAYGTATLARHPKARWLPGVTAAVAALGFLWWWPLYVGATISEEAWRLRILFDAWI